MTDIDSEVAAFRDQIEGLAAFDTALIASDVQTLATAMRMAGSHELAAVAVREFHDSRSHDPEYTRAVIMGALSMLTLITLISEPMDNLPGPDGMLTRLHRLAYAARGLGIGIGQLQHLYGAPSELRRRRTALQDPDGRGDDIPEGPG